MNKLLSFNDVKEYFNISQPTLYRLMNRGKIPFHKVGNSIRFRPEDVEKYLEENRINIMK